MALAVRLDDGDAEALRIDVRQRGDIIGGRAPVGGFGHLGGDIGDDRGQVHDPVVPCGGCFVERREPVTYRR